jgi:hypothetical protein
MLENNNQPSNLRQKLTLSTSPNISVCVTDFARITESSVGLGQCRIKVAEEPQGP